jgi:hypothetical protein
VLDGLVDVGGNPLMAWCISNVVVQRDSKDNILPDEEKEQRTDRPRDRGADGAEGRHRQTRATARVHHAGVRGGEVTDQKRDDSSTAPHPRGRPRVSEPGTSLCTWMPASEYDGCSNSQRAGAERVGAGTGVIEAALTSAGRIPTWKCGAACQFLWPLSCRQE